MKDSVRSERSSLETSRMPAAWSLRSRPKTRSALAAVAVIAAALGQLPGAASGSQLDEVARSPAPRFAATRGWHLVEGAASEAGQSIAITNWNVKLPDPHGFNHQIRPGRIAIFATSFRGGRQESLPVSGRPSQGISGVRRQR